MNESMSNNVNAFPEWFQAEHFNKPTGLRGAGLPRRWDYDLHGFLCDENRPSRNTTLLMMMVINSKVNTHFK
jgi:hypothetical protein